MVWHKKSPAASATGLSKCYKNKLFRLQQRIQNFLSGYRNYRSRTKHPSHAGVIQKLVILRRNYAARNYQNIAAVQFFEFRN